MPRPDVSVERKIQILKAAMDVFSKKGFHEARMEDIAHEAQLSIGGLYWYYKSKEDLIVAIMEEVIDQDVRIMANQVKNLRHFGEMRFMSTEADVVHEYIEAWRDNAEDGEPGPPPAPAERRIGFWI